MVEVAATECDENPHQDQSMEMMVPLPVQLKRTKSDDYATDPRRKNITRAMGLFAFNMGIDAWLTTLTKRVLKYIDEGPQESFTISIYVSISTLVWSLVFMFLFNYWGFKRCAWLSLSILMTCSLIRVLVMTKLNPFWFYRHDLLIMADLLNTSMFGFFHTSLIPVTRDWFPAEEIPYSLAQPMIYYFLSGPFLILLSLINGEILEFPQMSFTLFLISLFSFLIIYFLIDQDKPDQFPSLEAKESVKINDTTTLLDSLKIICKRPRKFVLLLTLSYWTLMPKFLIFNDMSKRQDNESIELQYNYTEYIATWSIFSMVLLLPKTTTTTSNHSSEDCSSNDGKLSINLRGEWMRWLTISFGIIGLITSIYDFYNDRYSSWTFVMMRISDQFFYLYNLISITWLLMQSNIRQIPDRFIGGLLCVFRMLMNLAVLMLVGRMRNLDPAGFSRGTSEWAILINQCVGLTLLVTLFGVFNGITIEDL